MGDRDPQELKRRHQELTRDQSKYLGAIILDHYQNKSQALHHAQHKELRQQIVNTFCTKFNVEYTDDQFRKKCQNTIAKLTTLKKPVQPVSPSVCGSQEASSELSPSSSSVSTLSSTQVPSDVQIRKVNFTRKYKVSGWNSYVKQESSKENYSLTAASTSWATLSTDEKQQWEQKEIVKPVSTSTVFKQGNDAVKKWAEAAYRTDNMHVVAFAWLRKENGIVVHHVHHSNTKFALHFLDTIGEAAADTTYHIKNFSVAPGSSSSSSSTSHITPPEEPKSLDTSRKAWAAKQKLIKACQAAGIACKNNAVPWKQLHTCYATKPSLVNMLPTDGHTRMNAALVAEILETEFIVRRVRDFQKSEIYDSALILKQQLVGSLFQSYSDSETSTMAPNIAMAIRDLVDAMGACLTRLDRVASLASPSQASQRSSSQPSLQQPSHSQPSLPPPSEPSLQQPSHSQSSSSQPSLPPPSHPQPQPRPSEPSHPQPSHPLTVSRIEVPVLQPSPSQPSPASPPLPSPPPPPSEPSYSQPDLPPQPSQSQPVPSPPLPSHPPPQPSLTQPAHPQPVKPKRKRADGKAGAVNEGVNNSGPQASAASSGKEKKRKAVPPVPLPQLMFRKWSDALEVTDQHCWLCGVSVVGKEEMSQVWVCTKNTAEANKEPSLCKTPFHAKCLTQPELLTKVLKCPCCDNLRAWLGLGTPTRDPRTGQVSGYSVHDSQKTFIAQLLADA